MRFILALRALGTLLLALALLAGAVGIAGPKDVSAGGFTGPTLSVIPSEVDGPTTVTLVGARGTTDFTPSTDFAFFTVPLSGVPDGPAFATVSFDASGTATATFNVTTTTRFIFRTLTADGTIVGESFPMTVTVGDAQPPVFTNPTLTANPTAVVGPTTVTLTGARGTGEFTPSTRYEFYTVPLTGVPDGPAFATGSFDASGTATATFVVTADTTFIFRTLAADGSIVGESFQTDVTFVAASPPPSVPASVVPSPSASAVPSPSASIAPSASASAEASVSASASASAGPSVPDDIEVIEDGAVITGLISEDDDRAGEFEYFANTVQADDAGDLRYAGAGEQTYFVATFVDDELVIVDSGSTDENGVVVLDIPADLSYFIFEENDSSESVGSEDVAGEANFLVIEYVTAGEAPASPSADASVGASADASADVSAKPSVAASNGAAASNGGGGATTLPNTGAGSTDSGSAMTWALFALMAVAGVAAAGIGLRRRTA